MRAARLQWLQILRQPSSAASLARGLARGLALGIFIAFMPIIPFQIAAIIVAAIPLKANKMAAVASSFICNAANMIPFYYLLFVAGDLVLPFEGGVFDPERLSLKELGAQGFGVAATMFAGGFLLGVPSSFATYALALRAIERHRRRRALRIQTKKRSLAETRYDPDLA